MERLTPVVFNDAWGSQVSLASLRAQPIPSSLPESELWMGAHEAGPAALTDRSGTLADLIADDPEGQLGADCIARFGPRLPFLLKILAPGTAISIQAHPTAEQAVWQRARSGEEIYGDDWAKPELLLALAPFEVFIGLRPWSELEDLIAKLSIDDLTRALDAARGAADPGHALLTAVLHTHTERVASLVREIVTACMRLEEHEGDFGRAASAIVQIAEDHPDDLGIVVLLLMNHRLLQPGEFVDVAAGVLHSYVRGLGLEVLANSDNVVRAGLTTKPVNVPELLRIVDSQAVGVVGRARTVAPGLETFDSDSDRFALHRVDPSRCATLPADGSPRVIFVLRGDVTVRCGDSTLTLSDVESAFLPASARDVALAGDGVVFVASVPPT